MAAMVGTEVTFNKAFTLILQTKCRFDVVNYVYQQFFALLNVKPHTKMIPYMFQFCWPIFTVNNSSLGNSERNERLFLRNSHPHPLRLQSKNVLNHPFPFTEMPNFLAQPSRLH